MYLQVPNPYIGCFFSKLLIIKSFYWGDFYNFQQQSCIIREEIQHFQIDEKFWD